MVYSGNTDTAYEAAERRVREMNRMAREHINSSNSKLGAYNDMRYSNMGVGTGRRQRPEERHSESKQSRSESGVSRAAMPPPIQQGRVQSADQAKSPAVHESCTVPKAAAQSAFPSVLSSIGLDGESALLILMIILLAREGADLPLLAALGYLLV